MSCEEKWRPEKDKPDEDQRNDAVEQIRVDEQADSGDEKRAVLLSFAVDKICHATNARENVNHQGQCVGHTSFSHSLFPGCPCVAPTWKLRGGILDSGSAYGNHE